MFKEIASAKGQLIVGFFKDEKSFKDGKPHKRLIYNKSAVKNGRMEITVAIEPGVYGVSVLDDENSNNDMDYNMLGIPQEGFGFSNYYHTTLSRPKLKDFVVDLGKQTTVEIRMKYKVF